MLMGLAGLARKVYHDSDLQDTNDQLLARLQADDNDATAWLDLSILATLRFQHDLAAQARRVALSLTNHYTLPAVKPQRLTLLALLAPGDLMANTPLEFLLENSTITLHLLYLATLDDLKRAPAHDVLFVAVGQSDRNRSLLEALVEGLRHWPRPVINRPEQILRTGRDSAFTLLADIPGLVIPETARLHRSQLEPLVATFNAPLIVRPLDSHAGRDLAKVGDPAGSRAYLETVPDEWFYVSPYIDYAGPDGLFRKYRIVLLDTRSYAGHLAVSAHWMVHYLNAGMRSSASKRAEEARFMQDYDTDFARRHERALSEISRRTRLDYLILDCAELPDGTLLLFEIDTSAVIHDLDQGTDFAYKQAPMQRLFTAFETFLLARAVVS